jgi:hypothetical protein
MFSGKKLGWAGTSRHEFELEVRSTLWPPFYSTNIFLPQIYITLKNNGNQINKATIEVEVRKYDGNISSVTTINDFWGDAGQDGRLEINNWKPGSKKSFTAKIPGYRLPKTGTYIMRIKVIKWIPQGTPYEEIIKELKKASLSEEARKKVLEMPINQMEQAGIDPHRLQVGSFKGEDVFDGRIVDYFRVEEFSNVLNFGLIVATLILATATLLPYAETKFISLYNTISQWSVSVTNHQARSNRHSF